MPKITYVPKKFSAEHKDVIAHANAIIANYRRQATFSCHKTVDYDSIQWDDDSEPDVGYRHSAEEQHCAGALVLLEKLDKPNQMMRWMERLGAYDRTKLDMNAPVYGSFTEMKNAHRNAYRKARAK